MKGISILNDVLGPVMRGPSSSHTAGSFFLASMARDLLGERPSSASIFFDAAGSYTRCYREQGSDLAFAAALLGWPIDDGRFARALELSPSEGLDIVFETATLPGAEHPNAVRIELAGPTASLVVTGKSIGGGAIAIDSLDGWPVALDGAGHAVLVETEGKSAAKVAALLAEDALALAEPTIVAKSALTLVCASRSGPLSPGSRARLASLGPARVHEAAPLGFVRRNAAPFADFHAMLETARTGGLSAGRLGMAWEAGLLGLSEAAIEAEMRRRLAVMTASVNLGSSSEAPAMQLLQPTARLILEAEAEGRTAVGGLHTRAAARAMAAMNVNCGKGVVCAAPTAGSAGVLPGVMSTLVLERGLDEADAVLCLFAAGFIGLIIADRATFAAEVAGCQVEIGAAGAMAAAAVVESAGGSASLAADAAAICLQNTMGSVCDLVQGIVEIPCHTRNAAAAAAAFVMADLVMGGYRNPVPLDETVDAMLSVGRMMPPQLRVTSLGGLATTPSALAMKRI